MSELISVIVPIYKVEKYLERCIKSILSQTYKNMEIILVDDGSPDNCPEICDEWSKRDSRIQVIHKKNGGLSDARNAGLDIAKGVYVTFIDSDDYIHPQFLEVLYYVMKKEKAEIVSCNFIRVEDMLPRDNMPEIQLDNIQLKDVSKIQRENFQAKYISGSMLSTLDLYSVYAWNKLYHISLFKNVRFPTGKIHEDVGIWWKMVYFASKIVKVEDVLYYYYVNPVGITNKPYTIVHLDLVDILYDQYLEFKALPDEIYANKILRECMDTYPTIYTHLKKNKCFNREDKKIFFKSYKDRMKIALNNKMIKKRDKIKYIVYYTVPCLMDWSWHLKNKKI